MSDPASEMLSNQRRDEAYVRSLSTLINRLYEGGTYGTNPATQYTAGQTYFDAYGNPITYDPGNATYQAFLSARGPTAQAQAALGGNRYAKRNKPQAASNKSWASFIKTLVNSGGAYTGTGKTEGFTPEFFNTRKQAYINYAMPQLDRQYREYSAKATGSLSDRGLLGSNIANNAYSALNTERALEANKIVDTGAGLASDLQKDVEAQRATALGQLTASTNPTEATQAALGTAASYRAPSPLPAVTGLLSNWANNYLYTNAMGATPAAGGAAYGLPKANSAAPRTSYTVN